MKGQVMKVINDNNGSIRLHRNVRLIALLRISLCSGALIAPGFVALLQSLGLSLFEVLATQAVFSIAMALFEVPTGYLADKFGRKFSIVVGGALYVAGCVGYLFVSDFMSCIAIELGFALSMAFMSGSDEALMFDSLVKLGRGAEYDKLFGRIGQAGFLVAATASIAGGWLASIDIKLPFLVNGCIMAVGVIGTCFLIEVHADTSGEKVPAMSKVVMFHLMEHQGTRWLIAFSGIVVGFTQIALWLYQPYFALSGINLVGTGVAFSLMNVFASASSFYADRIRQMLGTSGSLTAWFGSVAFGHIMLACVAGPFGAGFVSFHQLGRGFGRVIASGCLNREAASLTRATVISLQSMAGGLVYGVLLIPIGLIADAQTLGIRAALAFAGVTLLTLGLMMMRFRPTFAEETTQSR